MASVGDRVIHGEGTSVEAWRGWPGLAQLPTFSLDALPRGVRVVVVAPHPDDEIIGCGGLMRRLAQRAVPVSLVALTDGGGSHPDSSQWPVARLLQTRPLESLAAAARLEVSYAQVNRLGFADGGLSDAEESVASALGALLQPGDWVFCTWECDGHPDHEAAGRACRRACEGSGARFHGVPVWTWHWASPADTRVPWTRVRRLDLDAQTLAAKRAALQCFHSQLQTDPSTGAAPILPAQALERVLQPWELYLV